MPKANFPYKIRYLGFWAGTGWRDIFASIPIVKVEVFRKAKVFEVVFNCVIGKGKVELSVY